MGLLWSARPLQHAWLQATSQAVGSSVIAVVMCAPHESSAFSLPSQSGLLGSCFAPRAYSLSFRLRGGSMLRLPALQRDCGHCTCPYRLHRWPGTLCSPLTSSECHRIQLKSAKSYLAACAGVSWPVAELVAAPVLEPAKREDLSARLRCENKLVLTF